MLQLMTFSKLLKALLHDQQYIKLVISTLLCRKQSLKELSPEINKIITDRVISKLHYPLLYLDTNVIS